MIFRWILLPLAAMSAASAEHAWDKPETAWSDADARQILADSPWAKTSRSITVRWEDALPVRLALRKAGISAAADQTGQSYSIAVVFSNREASTQITPTAELRIPGCAALKASGFKMLDEDDRRMLVVFFFPKTGPVEQPGIVRFPLGVRLSVHRIEFTAHVGSIEIKKTFAMHRMVYLGRTEL